MIKVSALVSVYKAQEFIEGCLEDLVRQSLFRRGELEIVVIDSNSPDDEARVVQGYQKRFSNIVYHRTAEREPLYQAWNRGIELASGAYITNANCDDRHHPEGLELFCRALDNRPEVDLVYGDVYESAVANEAFENNPRVKRYLYPEYFAPQSLLFYQFGCQPVWRKNIHSKMGGFSSNLRAAGDWDFSVRFALAGLNALHVPQALGSFLNRPSSISQQDSTSVKEQALVKRQYLTAENILKLYRVEGWQTDTAQNRARIFTDFSIRASSMNLPWEPGSTFQEPTALVVGFQAAFEEAARDSRTAWNLGMALLMFGKADHAKGLLEQGLRSNDAQVVAAWDSIQRGGPISFLPLSNTDSNFSQGSLRTS